MFARYRVDSRCTHCLILSRDVFSRYRIYHFEDFTCVLPVSINSGKTHQKSTTYSSVFCGFFCKMCLADFQDWLFHKVHKYLESHSVCPLVRIGNPDTAARSRQDSWASSAKKIRPLEKKLGRKPATPQINWKSAVKNFCFKFLGQFLLIIVKIRPQLGNLELGRFLGRWLPRPQEILLGHFWVQRPWIRPSGTSESRPPLPQANVRVSHRSTGEKA